MRTRSLFSLAMGLILMACSSPSGDVAPIDTGPITVDTASEGDAGDDDATSDHDTDAETDDTSDLAPDTNLPPLDRTLIPVDDALGFVDPFIGTGGLGYGYAAMAPAVQTPFGMIRVGPDTTDAGSHHTQSHFSGYYHGDPHLRGFSHTRLVGAALQSYGQLRVLPVRELDDTLPRDRYVSYDTEIARPGYYGVNLSR